MSSTATQPLLHRSASQLAQALALGETTAVELTQLALAQAAEAQRQTNAYLCLTPELALEQAAEVDAQRANGQALAPLAGVPIAIKDNLNLIGTATTCGSKILQNYVAPYDATIVQRLKAHGLPIIGKTNMDEFAMGSSNEFSAYGAVRNPWDTNRVPGGSSGGSAAAVAFGSAPLSLGSDTGGSVRQPAALCGLVGLKPTYGLVSRYGLVAFASSLDQISPFSRTVMDCALLLDVLAGHDPMDNTSLPAVQHGHTHYADTLAKASPTAPLRIGVITQLDGTGMSPAVEANFKALQAQFAEQPHISLHSISIPSIKEAIAAYYVIAPAEASSNLARFDGVRYGYRTGDAVANVADMYAKTRSQGFGPEVKRRIMLGTFALSSGYYDAYYGKAQRARQLLVQQFNHAFSQVDVLICPTSPSTAFALGDKTDDPIQMYLSDVATIPVNLAGIPAISIPCGFDEQGLPMGLQLMATHQGENILLQAAQQLETLTGLTNLLPQH